jgi:Raf kinase inhibitor-like YbhB/YbcL family protein
MLKFINKKAVIIVLVIILAFAAVIIYRYSGSHTTTFKPTQTNQINTTSPMTISSPAFGDNQAIPKKYSCDGDGINPALVFKDVPAGAKSLALIVEDPDAPTGTWIHWVMWNISPSATGIAENSVPAGAIQGQGSSGQNIYGAPCPPSGIHHYIFNVYALDSELKLPSYSTAENLQAAIQGHVLNKAQLVGLYGR